MLSSSNGTRSMALPKIFLLTGICLLALIIISHISGSSASSNAASAISSGLEALRASLPVGKSIQKRLQKAEQLWQESVDKRHDMYAAYSDPAKDMFPATDVPKYFAHPFTIWDFFPATYNCPHEMERVGRLGDGGKWTCGMSRYEAAWSKKKPKQQNNKHDDSYRPCVVYSFGVQNESSFEEEVLQRTQCEVFGLDFSVSQFSPQVQQLAPEQRNRAHFLQAGISGQTDLTAHPPFYNIQDLMQANGHDYIDVLKMDIEGFEFKSLDSLMRAYEGQPLPIGQLQVEIHLETHIDGLPSFLQWWERLEQGGLRPVWTEPNLLQVTLRLDDAMPRFAEYTFINAKHRRNVLLSD